MDPDSPFDRKLRRFRRDRAARRGEVNNPLHQLLTDELIDRLALITREFVDILELGCWSDDVSQLFQSRGASVQKADPGYVFANRSGGVQCDEDRLPFAEGSFDLIVSTSGLDTVNDLPGALVLIRRALRPDGLFMAALPGAGSLPRLRRAMLAADEELGGAAAPHLHPQIDVRAAGDLLVRAGFTLPVVDSARFTLRYSRFHHLVQDLRGMAATNILASRSPRPILRRGFAAAAADFAAQADADGKTSEAVEILFLAAWSPAPDQPRPAQRGSASHSLASVLKPPNDEA